MSGGRDIAVSYASAFAGTLAILATFLLSVAIGSRVAGLAAALALATEYQAIAWSMNVSSRQPSRLDAIVAGVAAAGACLTRISSLSFIVPALLWMVAMPGPVPRRIATRTESSIPRS